MSTLPEQNKMIFVVGNSRSGTTMLGRILGRAKEIYTFNELHFFEQMWLPKLPVVEINQPAAVQYMARLIAIQRDGYFTRPDLSKYKVEAQRLSVLHSGPWTAPKAYAAFVLSEAEMHEKPIPCDHTPRNLFYVKEILDFFPNAHVVHIVRDPRDVLLSQKNRWRRRLFSNKSFPLKESIRSLANYHPISISLLWKRGINAWEEVKNDSRVFQFRFEDLLEDPEKTIRDICVRVEIKYHPRMLEVPQVGSSHTNDRSERFGVNNKTTGHWKRARREDMVDLAICQSILKTNMSKFNYSIAKFNVNPSYCLMIVAFWPIKAMMAIFANLDKSTNIIAFIRRRLG